MSNPNLSPQEAQAERQRYYESWNKTMELMWQEQIVLLKAFDTGALFRSIGGESFSSHNESFTEMQFRESFLEYGIYVERGTGSNTPKGNPGDIGRDNPRKKKPWLNKKWWYSTQRIKDFMADNIGREFIGILATNFK